jgi:hypothetical protein
MWRSVVLVGTDVPQESVYSIIREEIIGEQF